VKGRIVLVLAAWEAEIGFISALFNRLARPEFRQNAANPGASAASSLALSSE
jgi:hypothetical protein